MFACILQFVDSDSANAQSAQGVIDPQKSARIVRSESPPLLDGTLDDAAWREATVIDDFHQVRPGNGTRPTERTEVYLLYDDDFLYIGGRLYDNEPERISANVMRHNQATGRDDRIAVIIDPFNTGRNGYRFETNANGVRLDILYKNVNEFTLDWKVIWETYSAINEEGWTFEMAIPFRSLPFNTDVSTWGINFARTIRRRDEEMVWVSRNRGYSPAIVGHITGLEGMNQGVGLDVVPSLALNRRRVFSGAPEDSTADPSLDLFYRVSSSLLASLTVNTDFSATEVDNRQVNLTRFNLFFPEKRIFF